MSGCTLSYAYFLDIFFMLHFSKDIVSIGYMVFHHKDGKNLRYIFRFFYHLKKFNEHYVVNKLVD